MTNTCTETRHWPAPIPVLSALLAVMLMLCADAVAANPLNRWQTSCRVDAGAISKSGTLRTFRTSRNHCEGGIFRQRAEIASDAIRPDTKGAWLFETHIAMKSASDRQFTIFQIHDARQGCAPPLSMDVLPDGRLLLKSDIKTGPGESCIRGALSDQRSRGRLRRDGSEQKLSVLVAFDGQGGFALTASLDGVAQLSGRYDPSRQPAEYRSKKFYFKHGAYSKDLFDYVMTSRDMTVRKVRLAN